MDLFLMDYALNKEDRVSLTGAGAYPTCCSCDCEVEVAWLRKSEDQPLHHAKCLPCFLLNHTTASTKMVKRVVEIGQKHGFYKSLSKRYLGEDLSPEKGPAGL